MHEGFESVRLGLRGIPASSEDVMVARDILLAETRRRALPRGQEPQFTVRRAYVPRRSSGHDRGWRDLSGGGSRITTKLLHQD